MVPIHPNAWREFPIRGLRNAQSVDLVGTRSTKRAKQRLFLHRLEYERICATAEAFIYVVVARLMVRRLVRTRRVPNSFEGAFF
jgi:hypothetical protein